MHVWIQLAMCSFIMEPNVREVNLQMEGEAGGECIQGIGQHGMQGARRHKVV